MSYEHVTPGGDEAPTSIRSVSPRAVVALLLALLALIFVGQNTDRGEVDFLLWTIHAPTWLWLLSVFVAGVIVGSVLPWLRRRHRT